MDSLRHAPGIVVRMKQSMGFMGEGLAQIVRIKLIDLRVLMGEAERPLFVQLVELRTSHIRHLKAVRDGLASSAHASAGTGHDFHEVILLSLIHISFRYADTIRLQCSVVWEIP